MSPALVVIEDADRDRQLLERARSFALGEETHLVVLSLATPDEYEEFAETLDAIGRVERTTYDEDAILKGLASDAKDLAAEMLGDDVEYVSESTVSGDNQAQDILAAAETNDCDHVFVPGRRRSPTGKVVFGDRTQRVILEFDGFVTVSME